MDTSRTTAASSAAPPDAKRRRTAVDGEGAGGGGGPAKAKDPRRIAIWNCNGLAPRVKGHPKPGVPGVDRGGGPLHRLVDGLGRPDVICVQEVRLKADSGGGGGAAGAGSLNAGRPHPSEWDEVRHVFEGDPSSAPFADYVPVWSLCHRRYSGTLALVRRDLFPSSGKGGGGGVARPGNGCVSDEWVRDHVAFSVKGAIDLMLKCHGVEKADLDVAMRSVDLGSEGGEGNRSAEAAAAAATKGPSQPRQSKLSSFFVRPAASSGASSGRPKPSARKEHHPEGRIQFLRFPSFDVLHTYVPNNGMKPESFADRRMFDLEMRRLLLSRLKVLELSSRGGGKSDGNGVRPLLWCGDMNVARDYRDGTNWERGEGGTVYEWWTDESKCFASKGRNNSGASAIVKDPGDVGMPSFTPAERSRFSSTMEQAGLVDVWRQLHPEGLTVDHCPLDNSSGGGGMKEKNRWDRAEYTWRGALGVGGNRAKYQGRAQRLDYFLLSEDGYRGGDGVASCEILGWGERKEGLFCSSDHCAVLLVLAG